MEKKRCFDQLGRFIEFDFPPQRIISLVPSQTELLFELIDSDRIVGVTKFCVHPVDKVRSKAKIGGTKNFRLAAIDQLCPDLIFGNKEENDFEGIAELTTKYPVWVSDIDDWSRAMQMIRAVGGLVGAQPKADALVAEIQKRFSGLKPLPPRKVLYLIWKNPWMAAGKSTFIDSVISKIGLENCINEERYPTLSAEKITTLAPEMVLLSSEPFPFQAKHIREVEMILPFANVILVDGAMFSWYGSRLLRAPDYVNSLSL